jgi:uncharacterized membrane protein YphA (DoxX/SURF4 family)
MRISLERGTSEQSFEAIGQQRDFLVLSLGFGMQRLFSTFPHGWPGAGLLLLRICLGVVVIYFGAVAPSGDTDGPIGVAQNLIAAAGGIFFLAGLWTPVMGTLLALDEVWMVMLSPSRPDTWFHIFLAGITVSVAMLGPGAWSIDARLFGRMRVDFASPTHLRNHSFKKPKNPCG